MTMKHAANNTPETALVTVGGCQNPRFGSNPRHPVNDFTTLYNESMSSPRRVLSRKNSDHPRGNITMTGRFTTTQVHTAASTVVPISRPRPVRTANIANGNSNNTG